jgi:nickel-dependent lactate racemase
MDAIEAMHALAQSERATTGLGRFDGNPVRLDVEEATRMAGLDIKVDGLINGKGETADLFVGDPIAVHREGVTKAMEVYATDRISGANVVVANIYSKANEAWLALRVGAQLMDDAGGDLVVIANSPEGQITHYLLRSFGKNIGGRLWQPRTRLPRKVKRLIIMAPYADRTAADVLGPPQSIIWAKTWGDVVEEIKAGNDGEVRIAVVPDVAIQYFPAEQTSGGASDGS